MTPFVPPPSLTPSETATVFSTATETPTVGVTETASVTPTASPTESATAGVTVSPDSNTNAFLPQIQFTETFDDSLLGSFLLLENVESVAGVQGNGIRLTTESNLLIQEGYLHNSLAQWDVLVESGSLIWQTNASALGAYNLQLSVDGNVFLRRGDQVVATTSVIVNGWMSVQWLNVDGVIRVVINDQPVLTYVDSQPLLGGTIQLFTRQGSTLLDNLTLRADTLTPTLLQEANLVALVAENMAMTSARTSLSQVAVGSEWIGYIAADESDIERIGLTTPSGTISVTLWTYNVFTTRINDFQVSPDGTKVILTTNITGAFRAHVLNTAVPNNFRRADISNSTQLRVQWAANSQGFYYSDDDTLYYLPLLGGLPTLVYAAPSQCSGIYDFVLSRDYSHTTQTGFILFQADCYPNTIIEIDLWRVTVTGAGRTDVTAAPPIWGRSLNGLEFLSPDQTQIVRIRRNYTLMADELVRLNSATEVVLGTVLPFQTNQFYGQVSWGGSSTQPVTPTPFPTCPPPSGISALSAPGDGGDVCQILTPVPPTPTPIPQIFRIVPETLIVNLPNARCPNLSRQADREICAIQSLNNYRNKILSDQNRQMNWADFVSLVIYSEGHSIMLGRLENEQLSYDNPQDSIAGSECWRWSQTNWDNDQKGWVSGSVHCANFGVQQHFPYAVSEWILNECAKSLGYQNYQKNGQAYNNECGRSGFLGFLAQVQSLYVDPLATRYDPYLYNQRAVYEISEWANGRRIYGTCPCSWGNVIGSQFRKLNPNPIVSLDTNNNPIYPVFEFQDPRFGQVYNNNHSYSFFYQSNESIPYFRIN